MEDFDGGFDLLSEEEEEEEALSLYDDDFRGFSFVFLNGELDARKTGVSSIDFCSAKFLCITSASARSLAVTNEVALPPRPARAVLPTRCKKLMAFNGKS